jgi:hypothetical protein
MKEKGNQCPGKGSALFRNWIGILGVVLTTGGLVAVLCMIAFDFFAGFSHPYLGVLTYLVLPGFIWGGLMLMGAGIWYDRRLRKKATPAECPALPLIDLNNPQHRRNLIMVSAGAVLLLLFTAFGSYRSYQVTESVQFCGALCHTVMQPEYTTYQNSPHARVRCTECHIGPGASWFVRSKFSGMYQVYAVATNSFPRPIPVPVKNLRPARETCEECHWPEKFHGATELFHKHHATDEANTPWSIRMLIKVGGANPIHGPVGGIHWHMIVANKIEYIPADDSRQTIPWVRITNRSEGRVAVYESEGNKLKPEEKADSIRVLDCIDCHNRPTHIFQSPDQALDIALWLNRIDPSIPDIKMKAAKALVGSIAAPSQDEGIRQVAETLQKEYSDFEYPQKVRQAVAETQEIYRNNFFPEMKTSWKERPDNIGHRMWPGCFRCHDGSHFTKDSHVISKECNACHTILSQGHEPASNAVDLAGLEFEHPGGEISEGTLCSECHTGAP